MSDNNGPFSWLRRGASAQDDNGVKTGGSGPAPGDDGGPRPAEPRRPLPWEKARQGGASAHPAPPPEPHWPATSAPAPEPDSPASAPPVATLEPPPAAPPPVPPAAPAEPDRSPLHEIKSRIHRKLIERLNLAQLDSVDRNQARSQIRKAVHDLLARESVPLNFDEREALVTQLLDEIFGLGPLEPLLADPEIADILINTHKQIIIERHGQLETTNVRFQDDKHLMQVIDRIVSAVGRRVDESSPMVDARLADGSRFNAIIPPLAIDGPHVSIRKFRRDALSGSDLVRFGTLTEPMLQLLEGIVKARLNVLISGGTGAGKTTLLNILSSFIPTNERIVTIEDSAELQMRQPHVVRLETRQANVEGQGEISQRGLLINALRMRPDRVVVGEVRGGEAVDMLQAMNTGHDGSITTLHANTPRDALSRLETMVSMANLGIPEKAMRQQIASAIDVVIQVSRLSDGKRKVMYISEVVGMEGDVITMQDIFFFERQGLSEDNKVLGRFRATGIRPNFAEKLKSYGIPLASNLFGDAVVRPAAAPARGAE
jgi:pilus assembly protein CpaF